MPFLPPMTGNGKHTIKNHLFILIYMVKLGMVYDCFTHLKKYHGHRSKAAKPRIQVTEDPTHQGLDDVPPGWRPVERLKWQEVAEAYREFDILDQIH